MVVRSGLKTILMEKELHLVLVFHWINSNDITHFGRSIPSTTVCLVGIK